MMSKHTTAAARVRDVADDLLIFPANATSRYQVSALDAIARCETALALHRIADAMEERNREEAEDVSVAG